MALGKKTGGGSRKGKPNRNTERVRSIIDRCVDMREMITKLAELGRGVEVAVTKGNRTVTYSEKPDPLAIKILLEYRFGKPSQILEHTTPDEEPFPVMFIPPIVEQHEQ